MSELEYNKSEKQTITGVTEIEKGVFLLSFERRYDFIPGQIIAISIDDGDPAPRLYSICSGINEQVISILFNIVPGGKMTSRLSVLKPGDLLNSSRPYGRFTGSEDPSVWIATGTGIAPFISMTRSGQAAGNYLIHGGREEASFYFKDEFEKVFARKYTKCSSTLKQKDYFPGRITAYLKQAVSLPPDHRYYLCGHAEMIVEARDILISRGVHFNKIESEIYF